MLHRSHFVLFSVSARWTSTHCHCLMSFHPSTLLFPASNKIVEISMHKNSPFLRVDTNVPSMVQFKDTSVSIIKIRWPQHGLGHQRGCWMIAHLWGRGQTRWQLPWFTFTFLLQKPWAYFRLQLWRFTPLKQPCSKFRAVLEVVGERKVLVQPSCPVEDLKKHGLVLELLLIYVQQNDMFLQCSVLGPVLFTPYQVHLLCPVIGLHSGLLSMPTIASCTISYPWTWSSPSLTFVSHPWPQFTNGHQMKWSSQRMNSSERSLPHFPHPFLFFSVHTDPS